MILADKIIELRKRNGWSQEDLAEKLNVSRQSISKWEGAQSIPDMNKIIKMSEIFGVSTDVLLKDSIDLEETKDSQALVPSEGTKEDVCELRTVSMDEATAFLEVRESSSRLVSIGVMLCILSPIALILLSGLAEFGKIALTEAMAAGAGLIVLFLLVGPAVAMFIKSGMDSDPYEYMGTELIDTQYGVDGMVRSRKERFHAAYVQMMIIGIVLCVVSVLPIFVSMMLFGETEGGKNEIYYIYSVCALLVMVALGVFLIVRASIIKDGYDMILEEGDYTRKAKVENKKNDKLTSLYWMIVTAAYLGYSFLTNQWDRSWIIWPVAGVVYGIVIVIADTLREKD